MDCPPGQGSRSDQVRDSGSDDQGGAPRVTMVPKTLADKLNQQLPEVRRFHRRDLAAGAGEVVLPGRSIATYPAAGRDWAWQWVFPAGRTYAERGTGVHRRHPYTRALCSGPSTWRSARPKSRSGRPVILFDTPSPRTCLRAARISDDPAVARSPKPYDHDDLHPCAEQGRTRVRSPADLLGGGEGKGLPCERGRSDAS